ncbi:PucR family transcriptional regulator [Robertmurraya kyonggiensis]|uniref:PucR family transcriptional regulator n=1 Tax=Robertmurraya kyonggiensis TaxID=1037680 RepID=A0A4U1D1C5_9BACI|nr:PucR family transcriptional regulator [Robertmurraya kyonggiensis]TKC16109.1 PucR family transcriptional regulator [Robertmurraya kyonggiensis]
MKVSELLAVPHFAGMNMIAGASGKEREVHTVNMMDAPDIIHFLNQNELLVTTAYHVKDHPDQLTELIRMMSEKGCAALGIKTKRFLKEIPQSVIDLANELSFPIIDLPIEISLGEIVNHTLRAISDKRATELSLAFETHKQFTQLILQGKGIPKLLQDLSQTIGYPVQLINQHLKPIFKTNSDSELFTFMNSIRKEAFTLSVKNTSSIAFSLRATRQAYTLFPIYFSEKKIGFLSVMGDIQHYNPSTLLTIDQAINVISFALMKEQALKQQTRSIRNDFFLRFIDGAFPSETETLHRAAEFSLPNNQMYVVAGKLDDTDRYFTYTERQQTIDDIYEFIEDEVNKGHFFTLGDCCIILFEIHQDSSIEKSLLQLQSMVLSYFDKTISFGVSNISHTFLQTKHAYKEALDALKQGELLKKTNFIQTFQTKDVIELLRLIPEKELKTFYRYTLQGFFQSKAEEEQTLLETLSVFLDTNCQISETAKRLFVHRNTVVYRIEKCEEILGKSLKESETTLQLRIALRLKTLLEL